MDARKTVVGVVVCCVVSMLGVIEMQGRWPGATALAEPSAHPRAADFLQPLHPDEEGGREEEQV